MQTITVFVDGKSYHGSFEVNGNEVTLEAAAGRCVTSANETSAVMAAVQSLRDLVIGSQPATQAQTFPVKEAAIA